MATVNVDVDIDIDDYLDEVIDEALIEEVESRGKYVYNQEMFVPSKDVLSIKKDECSGYKLRDHLLDIIGYGHHINDNDIVGLLKKLLQK